MSDSIKIIEKGRSIMIHRRDGRKHTAVITEVNTDSRTVLVEWVEGEEIKGKEIAFVDVLNLNPDLKPNSFNIIAHDINCSKKKNYQLPTGITSQPFKDVSRLTLINVNSKEHSNALNSKRSFANYDQLTPKASINNTSYATTIKDSSSRISLIPPSNLTNTNTPSKLPRTSVLLEIEKLKKNREERRHRQAIAKEEQKALMNIYPKNPNWKFAKMIDDYQSTLVFKSLNGTEKVESRQITVCVRKRPFNKNELARNEIDVTSIPTKNLIIVHEPKNKVDLTKYLDNQHFYFDYVFDGKCSNEVVYKYTAKPLIETIFEGGMATCFAYGQTGSGKTHTMGGIFTGRNQNLEKGLYVMASRDVFEFLSSPKYYHYKFIVSATFFEIYQGKVFDLLAKKTRLRVLEDGKQQVQVVGLTEKVVTSIEGVLSLLRIGNSARACGKTTANSNSSRSHAVFQIILRIPSQIGSLHVKSKLHGKFSLIDLAGNERGVDTCSANRITQIEGAEINKSLLALKECIRALGKKGSHLPFRQSKLTQVLRDSFVGEKSKICMIAMISPGMSCCEHTLNTLRYADRVKELEPNKIEEQNQEDFYMGESQDLFAAQPLWNELTDEMSKEIFTLENSDDIQDDLILNVRFGEDISNTISEISFQKSEISNILNKMPQEA